MGLGVEEARVKPLRETGITRRGRLADALPSQYLQQTKRCPSLWACSLAGSGRLGIVQEGPWCSNLHSCTRLACPGPCACVCVHMGAGCPENCPHVCTHLHTQSCTQAQEKDC